MRLVIDPHKFLPRLGVPPPRKRSDKTDSLLMSTSVSPGSPMRCLDVSLRCRFFFFSVISCEEGDRCPGIRQDREPTHCGPSTLRPCRGASKGKTGSVRKRTRDLHECRSEAPVEAKTRSGLAVREPGHVRRQLSRDKFTDQMFQCGACRHH